LRLAYSKLVSFVVQLWDEIETRVMNLEYSVWGEWIEKHRI